MPGSFDRLWLWLRGDRPLPTDPPLLTDGVGSPTFAFRCAMAGYGVPTHAQQLDDVLVDDNGDAKIEHLEDFARAQRVAATQIMMPPSFVLVANRPRIVVVKTATSPPRLAFQLLWRVDGSKVQVVDARTRQWVDFTTLQTQIHAHVSSVHEETARASLRSPWFLRNLETTLAERLGVSVTESRALVSGCIDDDDLLDLQSVVDERLAGHGEGPIAAAISGCRERPTAETRRFIRSARDGRAEVVGAVVLELPPER